MTRLLIALCFVLVGCTARATEPAPFILVDQFGYLPELEKRAVIRDPEVGFDADRDFEPGATYAVVDVRSGRVVHEGEPRVWNGGLVDPTSGDRAWWFDFSSVTKPGTYVVRDLDRGVDSDPFEISDDVFRDVLRAAFKVFYYQRAGSAKRDPFVRPAYADAASHLGPGQDAEARRYDAPGDAGTARDLRGGWYDAGDYNQYTSWTANYVSSLIETYRDNPAIWTDDMGIPESGNGVPDILDEAAWGLAWLSRMQTADGSVLSVLGRDDASPPSRADGPSHYGPASTSATVTSAGAFALAAEVFGKQTELSALVQNYSRRAVSAWQWAEANPTVSFYNNSPEHGTEGLAAGQQEVEADTLARKRLIAAAQLYGLTRDPALVRVVERLYGQVGGIKPDTANGHEGDLGFTLLRFAARDGVSARFTRRIQADYAESMKGWNGWDRVRYADDPYGAYVDGYWWGSNGVKARRGSVYAQAALSRIEPKPNEARNAASHYLHALHGVNPMGLVYLSNMEDAGAERSVTTMYHAWYEDGTVFDDSRTSRFGPPPGFVVGGPNASYGRDTCCATGCGRHGDRLCRIPAIAPPDGQPPAKSYGQFNDGWPLNSWEVTEPSLGYQADYLRLLGQFVR